jgi:hypothetical protein
LFSLGNVWHRDADVVTDSGVALLGVELAPRYALHRNFQVGLRGVYGGELSTRGTASSNGTSTEFSRAHWALAAELRWLPFDAHGLWLGADAGAGAMHDAETTGSRTLWSETQWAPGGGAGAGWDFPVSDHFQLGVASRYSVFFWREAEGALPPDGRYTYGTQPVLWVGGNLSYVW